MKIKEREVKEYFLRLTQVSDLVLPSKLSFAISYNMEKFQQEFNRIEKEREKLCERYADKDEDERPVIVNSMVDGMKKQTYKMSEENSKLFAEEYEGLLDVEVDIEIRTVKKEVVQRCEEADRYNIPSVSQLFALSFMMED